jgi:hypothetical protein
VQRLRRDERNRLLDPAIDDRGRTCLQRLGVHHGETFPPATEPEASAG